MDYYYYYYCYYCYYYYLSFFLIYAAFGTDAFTPEAGQNNLRFRVHEEFLPNGVLILEYVANLDMMPPMGSQVFVGAIKIKDGSGGPCRIFAIYGDDGVASSMSKVGLDIVMFLVIAFCLILNVYA